jgi:hypothetical protein
VSGGAAAPCARREELALRAAAERERVAGQLDAWSGSWERATRGSGWLGTVGGRQLPVAGIGIGLVLAALAFTRSPALRGALVRAPVVWRVALSVWRLVERLRG